jgi:adenosine deaminase CECR1
VYPHNTKWRLLSDLRIASDDVELFDAELRKHLTMFTDDEDIYDADINFTWQRFNKVAKAIKSIINYRPVREKFLYKALENFYNDNVMYVEFRTGLHSLYELDGTKHDVMYSAEIYHNITEKFSEEHPDFIGAKLILTAARSNSIETIRKVLNFARCLKEKMPDFVAGFDLVGQEDIGKPLIDFLPILEEAKDDINYYFHGGETNWLGMSTDENGHAFALLKHPILLTAVKERNIAVEVNVISNVVLSLVRDVRNHPLATYLALGYPVVLSSDDPGIWEADPLSHDFYVAFMGVASKHADLRMLKQLILNSIVYSALNENNKERFNTIFNQKWDLFIKSVINREL